jgi:NTP pyrophosphatase (non-canonical NTP hydrolase)
MGEATRAVEPGFVTDARHDAALHILPGVLTLVGRMEPHPHLAAVPETVDRVAEACHANSVNKGFWENPRNEGEAVALIHSELTEAYEGLSDWQHRKSDHVPEITAVAEELADVVIRVFDLACAKSLRLGDALVMFPRGETRFGTNLEEDPVYVDGQVGEAFLEMNRYASHVLEALRHPERTASEEVPGFTPVEAALARLLAQACHTANDLGIDLGRAVALKMAFNAGRPHKHGKAF